VEGTVLAEVHATGAQSAEKAAASVLAAYEIGDATDRPHPIVLDVIG
jgi:hypothetical protein